MAIQYNVTLHGDIVNTDGILSNFGANKYAELPTVFAPTANDTWEIYIKCTASYGQCAILGANTLDDSGIYIIKLNSGNVFPLIKGENGDITSWGDYGYWVGSETAFEFKLSYDGTKYTWTVDGVEQTINDSTPIRIATQPFVLGNNADMESLYMEYDGRIDLNGSYMKINDQYVWQGVTETYNGVHIQLRRDTLSNWTSANPTLYNGEVGLITDQAKYVVGDGASTFSNLTKHNMDTDISNLADTSLSNLTSSGKQLLSSAGMPVPSATLSDDDIAAPQSGSPITASADGWLFAVLANASVGDYVQFNGTVTGTGIEPNGLISGSTATMTGQYLYIYVPMKEGQTTHFYYQATGSAYMLVFRFIKTYMEGV